MTDVDRLTNSHFWMVRRYVRLFAPKLKSQSFRDDMESDAALALIRAAGRYQPCFGSFINYASVRVRGACQDLLRHVNGYRRKYRDPQAFQDDPAVTDHALELVDVADEARHVMAKASGNERRAIELHYFQGLQRVEASRVMGFSASRVSQLLKSAHKRLVAA